MINYRLMLLFLDLKTLVSRTRLPPCIREFRIKYTQIEIIQFNSASNKLFNQLGVQSLWGLKPERILTYFILTCLTWLKNL